MCQNFGNPMIHRGPPLGTRPVVFTLVLLVRLYQGLVRPFLVGTCRFHPTCSEYAVEVVQNHGPWRGVLLTLRRLLRCHPFARGGIDPAPAGDAARS